MSSVDTREPASSTSRVHEDLDPAAFLKSVRELSEKREREDAERYRKLEEEVEKSRAERVARRAGMYVCCLRTVAAGGYLGLFPCERATLDGCGANNNTSGCCRACPIDLARETRPSILRHEYGQPARRA